MEVIYTDSYEALSKKASDLIAEQIKIKPNSVLGFATGGTPVGTYRELVRLYKDGKADFSGVTAFNLDEYCDLPPEDENSYRRFMNENLFNHISIGKTYLPNGMAKDAEAECKNYEEKILQAGGIDLQLLGIGHNGHIAFNEPSDFFTAETHVEQLSPETIESNKRFFENAADVPQRAITMGIATIMKARKILLIASGADKKEILEKALNGKITPKIPASVLQLHRDAAVIACVK